MEPKEYLSFAALTISLVSLAMSIHANRFSKRTKSAELKANLLAKILEASLTQSRIARHRGEASVLAFEIRTELYQELQEIDPAALSSEIMNLYERMVALTWKDSLSSYEKYFHEAHRMAERSKAQEDMILRIKAKCESLLASPRATSTAV